MTEREVVAVLDQAMQTFDHEVWRSALKVAGDWLEENGLYQASEVIRRAGWIHAQIRIEEDGPFPIQVTPDGAVTFIDEHGNPEPPPSPVPVNLAETSPRRPAPALDFPKVTLVVDDPSNLGTLITLALACARETSLTFMIPKLESLAPRDRSLWIAGPDRHAAADLIADGLARLQVTFSRSET